MGVNVGVSAGASVTSDEMTMRSPLSSDEVMGLKSCGSEESMQSKQDGLNSLQVAVGCVGGTDRVLLKTTL